ncbi:MAG TPA: hypothetical protein VFH03_14320 [Actinoplanes sp.]|nr:hypothetical protein [Actinoplanes sp.]
MRRPPAAAALTVLVLLAGCSTTSDRTATPGPAAAPAPAPSGSVAPRPGASGGGTGDASGGGDARLSGNTAAICNQAAKTGADFAKTFAANLELQIDAASASDPAAAQQAEQKSTRDVQNYSYALNDLSKLAADPAVKKALADMSKQVNALKGDLRKLDGAKLGSLRSTLDEACGRA